MDIHIPFTKPFTGDLGVTASAEEWRKNVHKGSIWAWRGLFNSRCYAAFIPIKLNPLKC